MPGFSAWPCGMFRAVRKREAYAESVRNLRLAKDTLGAEEGSGGAFAVFTCACSSKSTEELRALLIGQPRDPFAEHVLPPRQPGLPWVPPLGCLLPVCNCGE